MFGNADAASFPQFTDSVRISLRRPTLSCTVRGCADAAAGGPFIVYGGRPTQKPPRPSSTLSPTASRVEVLRRAARWHCAKCSTRAERAIPTTSR